MGEETEIKSSTPVTIQEPVELLGFHAGDIGDGPTATYSTWFKSVLWPNGYGDVEDYEIELEPDDGNWGNVQLYGFRDGKYWYGANFENHGGELMEQANRPGLYRVFLVNRATGERELWFWFKKLVHVSFGFSTTESHISATNENIWRVNVRGNTEVIYPQHMVFEEPDASCDITIMAEVDRFCEDFLALHPSGQVNFRPQSAIGDPNKKMTAHMYSVGRAYTSGSIYPNGDIYTVEWQDYNGEYGYWNKNTFKYYNSPALTLKAIALTSVDNQLGCLRITPYGFSEELGTSYGEMLYFPDGTFSSFCTSQNQPGTVWCEWCRWSNYSGEGSILGWN